MRRVQSAACALVQCAADFLFDDACHVCGERGCGEGRGLDPVRGAVAAPVRVGCVTNHPVCVDCAARLDVTDGETILGWRLPDASVLMASGELVSAVGCAAAAAAPGAIGVVSAFHTEETLLHLVHLIKFGRLTSLVSGLADALARAGANAAGQLTSAPVLVPVPMDRRSLRRRGFNQAERIATRLGKRWSLPVATDVVVKPHATRAQSLAARDERVPNVRGAYQPGPGDVAGRDVILVDDLVTTGATAAAVAVILAARGASLVTVASLGRAL